MTTNEVIARWMGWSGPHDAFTAPYPWIEPGEHIDDERFHWNPPYYDTDIALWHGEKGVLAEIEKKGLRDAFMSTFISDNGLEAKSDGGWMTFGVGWRLRCAKPAQLAAALRKCIEGGAS